MDNGTNEKRAKHSALVAALGLSVSGLLATVGCFPPREPVHATVQVPTLTVNGEGEQTRDGITIAVMPATLDTQRRFPQVFRRLQWTETDTSTGQPVVVQRSAEGSVVPLPAFQVRVANHTGHAVRFTQAVFRLSDNLGRQFPLFAGTAELLAWNEGVVAAQAPMTAGQPGFMSQLRLAVGQVPLFGRGTEMLNGDETMGYLAFNLGVTTTREQIEFLNGIERLTLRLAEVPVETNEAGITSRTTEFRFAFDKTSVSRAVTCPPGTTVPSLELCSAE